MRVRPWTDEDREEYRQDIDEFLAEARVPNGPLGYPWYLVLPGRSTPEQVWAVMNEQQSRSVRPAGPAPLMRAAAAGLTGDDPARQDAAMGMTVRPMGPADAAAVLSIYQAGLDTGLASFETVAPTWEAFDAGRLPDHRFVAVDADGAVLGWVAVSCVSQRCAYAGVVEHSVYVDPAAQGRGIGLRLLEALIESTEAAGIWTVQSGVFPENTASLRLHEKAGFRTIGIRHHPGRVQSQGGQWRDVVLLERRSPTVYPP